MTWALLIIHLASAAMPMATIPGFSSKDTCERAGSAILADIPRSSDVTLICVPVR